MLFVKFLHIRSCRDFQPFTPIIMYSAILTMISFKALKRLKGGGHRESVILQRITLPRSALVSRAKAITEIYEVSCVLVPYY